MLCSILSVHVWISPPVFGNLLCTGGSFVFRSCLAHLLRKWESCAKTKGNPLYYRWHPFRRKCFEDAIWKIFFSILLYAVYSTSREVHAWYTWTSPYSCALTLWKLIVKNGKTVWTLNRKTFTWNKELSMELMQIHGLAKSRFCTSNDSNRIYRLRCTDF